MGSGGETERVHLLEPSCWTTWRANLPGVRCLGVGNAPDARFSGLRVGPRRQPGKAPGLRSWPPPQVRFSRPESEQARQRRVQSYEFLQKKHAEEPWVHLHYYGLRVSWGPWAARTLASVGSWERSPSARKCHLWPRRLTSPFFQIEF